MAGSESKILEEDIQLALITILQVQCALVLLPDSTLLAAGNANGSIVIWDWERLAVVHLIEAHSGSIADLDFSGDMALLVSASGDTPIKIWNVATGQLHRTLAGQDEGALKIRFSPRGTHLISGSSDGTIRIWDPEQGSLLGVFGNLGAPVQDLKFHKYGALSAVTKIVINTWELGELQELRESWKSQALEGVIGGVSLETRALQDLKWRPSYTSSCGERRLYTSRPHSLYFSPKGKVLATGGHGRFVRLWCCETEKLLHSLRGHKGHSTALAFSPDGITVASGFSDTSVIWKAVTGEVSVELPGHQTNPVKILFSQDGTVLASASSDSIWFWATSSWTLI
jgi:WD40 repeat protein